MGVCKLASLILISMLSKDLWLVSVLATSEDGATADGHSVSSL